MPNIAIISNTSWSVFNFRQSLINLLLQQGFTVTVLAPIDKNVKDITTLGCNFIPLKHLDARSLNPLYELKAIKEIHTLLKLHHIEIALCYTPKINLYVGIAAKFCKTKIINTINGLGTVFSGNSRPLLQSVVKALYKFCLNSSKHIFFQNNDDLQFFKEQNIVGNKHKISLVNGSGVSLNNFKAKTTYNTSPSELHITYAGRLVIEKGINEYLEAAAYLKPLHPNLKFTVAGLIENKRGYYQQEKLQSYIDNNTITYLGEVSDIDSLLNDSDLIVFPSYYREGIPKVLIESCAKGLPIITCDSIGCKETVSDGQNGYLVPPQNSKLLCEAIQKFLGLTYEQRVAMGKASRLKAETHFADDIINNKYLEVIKGLN
jgi:glycosyltransferase involved in cell wall biosynthesis